MSRPRYALLTLDVEALPARASADHVQRLIWGRHARGTAGVAELVAVGHEFGVRHSCFVDPFGAYAELPEVLEVARWLVAAGQDVQLHTHPEKLPDSFWSQRGLSPSPRLPDRYADPARAELVIGHGAELLRQATGKQVLAHRAGSFRWNIHTLDALARLGIGLSFSNSMYARTHGRCPYAEPAVAPFRWSNGVVEIPVSERLVWPRRRRWSILTYPESPHYRLYPWWGRLLPGCQPELAVILLHSWSLLDWDAQGHAYYLNDRLTDGYRRLLARLTRDYEVITASDCPALIAAGRLAPTHTVDTAQTAMPAATGAARKAAP